MLYHWLHLLIYDNGFEKGNTRIDTNAEYHQCAGPHDSNTFVLHWLQPVTNWKDAVAFYKTQKLFKRQCTIMGILYPYISYWILVEFVVYTGTTDASIVSDMSSSSQVVLDLMSGLLDKGYCVITDNLYTCPALFLKLAEYKTDAFRTV